MVLDARALYRQEYVEKDFERLDILSQLVERYGCQSALYPGSFAHITPSFVIPVVVYVDTDRRAARFFRDPAVRSLVEERKSYADEPVIRFHALDYRTGIPEPEGAFDLLLSQWAGFVSDACTPYVRLGGLLLANNSHGDAGVAYLDPRWDLIAVANKRSGTYRLSDRNLERYFIPKGDTVKTRERLLELGRGVGYTHSAGMYLFRRTS